MRLLGVMGAVLGLAGCMSESPAEGARNKALDAVPMLERLEDMSPTQVFRVPSEGTATFNGYSTINVSTIRFTEYDDVTMVGRTTLNVSYDGPGTVTGSVTDLDALVGSPGDFRDVEGSVRIGPGGSSISGNTWTSSYDGHLDWGSQGVTLDGSMDGQFMGNRVSDPDNPIRGIVGGDLNGVGVLDNGGFAEVEIIVFGED